MFEKFPNLDTNLMERALNEDPKLKAKGTLLGNRINNLFAALEGRAAAEKEFLNQYTQNKKSRAILRKELNKKIKEKEDDLSAKKLVLRNKIIIAILNLMDELYEGNE